MMRILALRVWQCIALALVGFSLYTAAVGQFVDPVQRSTHLALALALAFTLGIKSGNWFDSKRRALTDVILAISGFALVGYITGNNEGLTERMRESLEFEIWLGIGATVLAIEATRRVIGWPMVILALAAIGYAFAGPYLPEPLDHRGYSLERIVSHLYLGDDGIFGIPLGVSATYVALIVTFGALLESSGAGRVLMDVATAMTGRSRGGPAKAAVVGSSLMGTISGTAVANVLTTGTVSIPLMRRTGYRPKVAAAIEAVASTGGQIMPPIMGAAAFIMAELILRPYSEIVLAATIPALLFYVAVFASVHFEAVRTGIRSLNPDELPNAGKALAQGGHLLLSVVVLVYGIAAGYSVTYAAFFAVLSILVLAQLRASTRMSPTRVLQSLVGAADAIVMIAVACAAAGIIIGVLTLTGLGLKFASLVVTLSGGNTLAALVLTLVASLILGMGLPTAAAYIIVAALIAPALVRMGVDIMAAHMFAFYGAMLSSITPPVAMAAYAGASLTGSNPMATSIIAVKYGIPAFIVPFFFVYQPELLMQGSWDAVAMAAGTAILGAGCIAAALQGWLLCRAVPLERLLLMAASLLLIFSGIATDIVGLGLLAAVVAWQALRRSRRAAAEPAGPARG